MVKNLFKFEFRKVFHSAFLYVCFGILALYTIAEILISGLLILAFSSLAGDYKFTENPVFGQLISGTPIFFIVGIAVIIYALKDYSDSTIKNVYGRGVGRTSYYFVRLLISVVIGSLIFVGYYAVEYIASSLMFSCWKIGTVNLTWTAIGLQYVLTLLYVTASFFLCSFIRKAGLGIATLIIGPTIILLVFNLIDAIMWDQEVYKTTFTITKYWVGTYKTSLSEIFEYFASDYGTEEFDKVAYAKLIKDCLIYFFSYSAAFVLAGFAICFREEVKN